MVRALSNQQLAGVNNDIRSSMLEMRRASSQSRDIRTVMNRIQSGLADTVDAQDSSVILDLNEHVPDSTTTYRELLERVGVGADALQGHVAADGTLTRGGAEHFLEMLRNHLNN